MMDNCDLRLHLPPKQESQNLACEPHPPKVKEWLERLPLSNTGETARLVYHELKALNRMSIAIQSRLQILELFKSPVRHITGELKKHYLGAPLPLAEINFKAAHLVRELHTEMANGYKIIATSLLTNEATASMTLVHLHRAMRHLSEVTLTSYLMYAPCPQTLWRDLHEIYRFTEQKKLHESPLPDTEDAASRPRSISEMYRHALLLALANPYQLAQEGIMEVSTALNTLASHSHLNTPSNPDDATGSFVINLEKDAPPMSLANNKDCGLDSCRALDTTDLIHRLYLAASAIETPEPSPADHNKPAPLSSGLARWLISAWGIVSRRSLPRLRKTGHVVVTTGLDAIHNALSRTSVVDAAHSFRKKDTAVAEKTLGETTAAVLSRGDHFKKQREQKTAAPKNPLYTTHICSVINESEAGACLSWKTNDTKKPPFDADELIAIQENSDSDTDEWSIAVIRWTKNTSNSELEFGLEMLSPSAEPVLVRTLRADRSDETPLSGLLLPELKVGNTSARLITPAKAFQAGTQIIINTPGGTQHALLTEVMENNRNFTQFHFMPVQAAGHGMLSPAAQEHDMSFDLLWNSL